MEVSWSWPVAFGSRKDDPIFQLWGPNSPDVRTDFRRCRGTSNAAGILGKQPCGAISCVGEDNLLLSAGGQAFVRLTKAGDRMWGPVYQTIQVGDT